MADNVIQVTIKGVDNASKAFGAVGKSSVKLGKSMAKASVGITAAAGAATAFVKVVANSQDKVQKFSDRLGVSVEALSNFHHAAELGGVSAETFNMGLQRMSRRVAEAGQGMGEAQTALRELNLQAGDLAKLPIDEQMNQVADALQGVEGQSERVRLAFKLFDSEGVALLQTMKNGSQSFKDAAADAAFLGITISSKAAAQSAAFNDSFTRVGASIKGVSMGIANEFMPAITELATRFANFVAENRPRIVAFLKQVVVSFLTLGQIGLQVMDKIRSNFSNLFSVEGFKMIVDNFQRALGAVLNIFVAVFKKMPEIALATFQVIGIALSESITFGFQKAFDAISGNNVIGTFAEEVGSQVSSRIKEEVSSIGPALAEIATQAKASLADAGGTLASALGIDPVKAQEDALATLETLTAFGEARAEIQTQQGEADVERKKFQLSWLQEVENEAAADRNKFEKMTTRERTKFQLDSLGGLFAQAGTKYKAFFKLNQIAGIANATINTAEGVTKALSAYPPPFSFAMAAAQLGAGLAQISAIKSQKFGGARADGGPVGTGSSFLVGERGPELFVPRQAGGIVPSESLGSGGSGLTIGELNININGQDIRDMTSAEVEDIVAEKVIPAFDALATQGIRTQVA